MNPVSMILGFFTGRSQTKLIALVGGIVAVIVVIGGMYLVIEHKNTEIAELESVISKRDADISAYKLEIKTDETEISLLKKSENQTAHVITSLQEQLAKVQKTARWYRIQHLKAEQLLASAKNQPVTNSTGVLSYEDSRNAALFINHTLGLQPKTRQ